MYMWTVNYYGKVGTRANENSAEQADDAVEHMFLEHHTYKVKNH